MNSWLRRSGVWVDAVVVTTIVAAGVVVAGVTNDPPAVTPAIPGCSRVLPAEEGVSFSFGYSGFPTYGNAEYPWLTAAKATAMSESLIQSLPETVELDFAPPSRSLVFQPIDIYPADTELPEGITVADISGGSRATGTVRRGESVGDLLVSVEASDRSAPPCVEGRVDERVTYPDGIVVDALDAVSENEGARTHGRTAVAYAADSAVYARLTDHEGSSSPLEIGELREIVTDPGLRVSASVPDGTPAPRENCTTYRESPAPPLTRDTVERIGAELNRQWTAAFPEARTDRPIGDLVPGDVGSGSACGVVTMTTPTGAGEVKVEISTAEDAGWRDSEPSTTPGRTRTIMPDGTLVITDSAQDRPGQSNMVTVLRPSNTLVQFRFTGAVDTAALVAVGSAPGLDL